ncbi:MAG: EamA family transporter [Alphaproteobacteria bacterium]|nr:EamA family transporter [Alphaproteobacteria bacterium]
METVNAIWGVPLWIPFTLAAAALQAIRTAAQRQVAGRLSPDAGNFARYVFGLPIALLYLGAIALGGAAIPAPSAQAIAIVAAGAFAQVMATRALIIAVSDQNFAVGVALSKTDVVQAAIVEAIAFGVRFSPQGIAGILAATFGVMVMSAKGAGRFIALLMTGWMARAALFGLAAGTGYAVSGVAYRAASLELGGPALPAAATALAIALSLQTVGLGSYIALRDRESFFAVLKDWRVSGLAGIAGGIGSICWFSALALETVAFVRTLGLSELFFSVLIAIVLFREKPTPAELGGLVILAVGVALVLSVS